MTTRVSANHVDIGLLRQQARSLEQIRQFLLFGEPQPDGDDWPEAIDGILNLLAALDHSTRKGAT